MGAQDSKRVDKLVQTIKSKKADSATKKRAVAELREWNAKNAPIANKRMRGLERADLTQFAYGRAIDFVQGELGSNSFRGGRALSLDDETLVAQVQELNLFLNKRKTSTVSGAKEMMRSRGEYLASNFDLDLDSLTAGQRNEFFRFLGSDSVMTFLKDVSGIYQVLFNNVAVAFQTAEDKRALSERLKNAIEKYTSGTLKYDELLDELGVNINDLSDAQGVYI